MKSLDRYILKQILLPTFLAFFLVAFLGIASEVRSNAEEFPKGFLTPIDFTYLVVFLLPSLAPLVVPTAYFFGILIAFGRLAQQGEITAMQAAGISLKRMVLPVVLLGIVISAASFGVQDWLQPWGMKQAVQIFHDLPKRATIDTFDEGELHEYRGWRIFFASKNTETRTLYDFDLIQPNDEGVTLFHADEARLVRMDDQYTLHLENGYIISNQNMRADFDSIDKPFPTPASITRTRFKRDSLNLVDLHRYEQYVAEHVNDGQEGINPKELHKTRYAYAGRVSSPFAALAIAVIGAPLGVRARRKGKTSLFSVGFGVILLYYALLTVATPTSLSDLSTYIIRAWIPNIALIGVGLVLFWKADRV